MRLGKMAMGVVAMALLLGAGTARANPISGQVVCAGTGGGVEGVTVWIEREPDWRSGVTDGNGNWNTLLPYAEGTSNVWLDLGSGPTLYGSIQVVYGGHYVFEVDVEGCEPPPPPPVCEAAANLTEGSFCPAAGLGNPKAECKYFGLVALDKDDGINSSTWVATTTAPLALVKAGTCYRVYTDVQEGDVLERPYSQAISHVTYCACPD